MTVTEMLAFLTGLGHGTDTETQQREFLYAAFRDLAGRRKWSWLEEVEVTPIQITAGNHTPGSWPTDLAHVVEYSLAEGSNLYGQLTRIDFEQWQQLNSTTPTTDRGVPQYYAVTNRTIRVFPRADKTYTGTLTYIKIPDTTDFDTTVGGDEPPFDARFHAALPWKAAAWMAFRQRDWSQMSAANGEYERIIREMEQAEEDLTAQGHMKRSDYYDQVK